MIGLDTNILVRFFAQDDPLQSPIAKAIMSSLTIGEPGWIGVASILELVWVMTSQKRLDRRGITAVLSQLITRKEIVIEQVSMVQNALQLYRKGNADFADCLIASSAKAGGCSRTVTFDRRAARDAGMQLLA
ncbi:MAG: type II toxin-antitoxin system VapC family toxin [Terracidiphilus sp.]